MNPTRPRILLTDAKSYDREFFTLAQRDCHVDIHYLDARLSLETVDLCHGFDTVCCFVNDTLNRAVCDRLVENGIRLVALRCAGYNNVDLEACFDRLHVVRVPAYSPHAVAEHTLAMLLCLNRKIHRAYQRTRDGNFSLQNLLGFDLNGKTAGVIGTGKIGRLFAQSVKALGMHVRVSDPFPDNGWADEIDARYVDLDTLLRESDVISLHCPLTPETHHMIDAAQIDRMKTGVFILNTGRGGLIDTPALIEGLKSRQIGAAGLDVYEEEDRYFFEDFSSEVLDDDVLARLLSFPNVLVTAHQAFFTREALTNIATTTLGNIVAFFKDGILNNEICYQCGAKPCRRKDSGACFTKKPPIRG